MIGFNGTYLPAASLGNMRITAAAIGGQWVMAPWLTPATQQAIIAAFGNEEGIAVILRANDYLNAIAATDTTRAQQLAMFINEDPMLVCSLVETSKMRCLYNVGKPYIDTGFIPTKDTSIDIMYDKQGKENYPYGSAISYNSRSFETYNNELHFGYPANVNNISNGVVHMWSNRNQYWWTNGGQEYSYTFNPFNDTFPYTLYLWALHRASIFTSTNELKMWFFKIYDNDQLVRHFLPMQRTDGTCGMLDIVSCTFHPNANTEGSFTIALTDKA